MTETVIVTIGYGPNGDGVPVGDPTLFARDVYLALVGSDFSVVARIDGEARSAWGLESSTWFSAIALDSADEHELIGSLTMVREWHGQDAIGVVIRGEYREV